jgi:hypothetical protein
LDIKVVNDDVLKPDMLNHQVRMFISTIPVN